MSSLIACVSVVYILNFYVLVDAQKKSLNLSDTNTLQQDWQEFEVCKMYDVRKKKEGRRGTIIEAIHDLVRTTKR